MFRHQFTPPPPALFILLILFIFFSITVHAATFTVTNLSDSGTGSLRQAILDANATGGSNTITFKSGLTGTITLTSGQLIISNNLTLQSPGAGTIVISGNNASRIFQISTGKIVTLDKLTLKNGYHATNGGAIYNAGTLILTNSMLTNNAAGTLSSGNVGGAISNGGTLTIANSTLSNNSAYYGGCIDNGLNPSHTLTITNSVLSNNSAYDGGCIYNSSTAALTITNSTLSGNTAAHDGAGIYNAETAGGVLSGGSLTVRSSALFDNTAGGSGGGGIYNRGTLVVSNSTFSGNTATIGDGGALWSGGGSQLTVSQSTITDNSATVSGGGLWLYGTRIIISNSLVSGNTAPVGKEIRQDNTTAGGVFDSQGYNLIGENGSAGVNGLTLTSLDLVLAGAVGAAIGPLADNGGPTLTHLPVTGGPAIDAGSNTLIPTGVTTDQRGQPRIQNSIVDIGAVEGGPVYNLVVTVVNSGTVTSNPTGINCSASCLNGNALNTVVTLTATPASGYKFSGWSGACSGTGTCQVTMSAAKSVTATFTPSSSSYTLTITKTGSGTVTSNPTGISCGTTCSKNFVANTVVTLTAIPASGYTFSGWSGACSGSDKTCRVTLDAAKNVTATFIIFTLTVNKIGSGTVTSNPTGISCGAICSKNFARNTIVALTATPASGYAFSGWSGACSGTGACQITMDAAKNVIATFTTIALTVNKAGSGTITSSPSGISCGTACRKSFALNTVVTLTATPASGYAFNGWSGACSGTGTCQVTMNAAKSVTATFTASSSSYALTVTKSGSGTVTSSPSGINCGATCSKSFAINTVVTLTATPATGSIFNGWSGACSGTGTCQVTMSAAKNVAATFAPIPKTLKVGKSGTGQGVVTSGESTPLINCGTTCQANYTPNTVVTLTATPASGSRFVRWNNSCVGNNPITTVTMSVGRYCVAEFAKP